MNKLYKEKLMDAATSNSAYAFIDYYCRYATLKEYNEWLKGYIERVDSYKGCYYTPFRSHDFFIIKRPIQDKELVIPNGSFRLIIPREVKFKLIDPHDVRSARRLYIMQEYQHVAANPNIPIFDKLLPKGSLWQRIKRFIDW